MEIPQLILLSDFRWVLLVEVEEELQLIVRGTRKEWNWEIQIRISQIQGKVKYYYIILFGQHTHTHAHTHTGTRTDVIRGKNNILFILTKKKCWRSGFAECGN